MGIPTPKAPIKTAAVPFWWSIGSTCPRTLCRSSPTTPARRWPSSVRISTATPADELHLIGITGTKGKTTTALLTAAIMTEAGLPCAYIGSNGVDIAGVHEATANTTPESLELHRLFRKMLDAGVRHCVLEVSSQALRHHRVDGVPFEVVAFTNLSEDHIGPGEHPDFEDYKCAKRRLFAEYNARTMVYNVDDPYSDFMREGFKGEQISFGIQNAADYHGQNLAQYRSQTALGVDFDCVHAGETTHIEVMSPGTFSASDALCAVALCGAFGVTPAQAAATLAHTPVQGRFEVVEGLPGRTFIVDYSHNRAGPDQCSENAAGIQSAPFTLCIWVGGRPHAGAPQGTGRRIKRLR